MAAGEEEPEPFVGDVGVLRLGVRRPVGVDDQAELLRCEIRDFAATYR